MVVLATGAYWKMIPDRYILDAARHIDPEMAAQELYGCYTAHVRRPTTSILVMRASGSLGGVHPPEARPSGPADRQEVGALQEPLPPRDRPRTGGASGWGDGRQPAPGPDSPGPFRLATRAPAHGEGREPPDLPGGSGEGDGRAGRKSRPCTPRPQAGGGG